MVTCVRICMYVLDIMIVIDIVFVCPQTLQVKVMSLGTNVGDGSSQESSSDSDRVSPQFEGPNLEHEKGLPSVVSSAQL